MIRGAVAQLGERLVCNQEVIGSIPISSTRILGWIERSGSRGFSLMLGVHASGLASNIGLDGLQSSRLSFGL
jgi:hypothetical protein